MNKMYKAKREEGFTIIEVLIVLAIAGLIILIVFLAVPALQRNSRNTSRKSDIGRLGSVVTEFVANRNGQKPTASSTPNAGDAKSITDSAGTLSQYDFSTAANGVFQVYVDAADHKPGNTKNINLGVGVKCDSANAGSVTATGATGRSMALQYSVESGSSGATTDVCTEI